VLLDYEDDALYAQRQGEPISIVTPPQTILIENPIAVTTKAADPAAAKAFVAFLLTPAGQKIWGQQGTARCWRACEAVLVPEAGEAVHDREPGGWTKVNGSFFDPETARWPRSKQASRLDVERLSLGEHATRGTDHHESPG